MPRRAGLLIPLFSLRTRSGWGVGEIPDLVPMARWARRAGFTVLQLLPVNEAAPGQASPYFARTAFGIDPAYLRVDDVPDYHAAGGRLALADSARGALERVGGSNGVDWGTVRTVKRAALELAFANFQQTELAAGSARARQFLDWCRAHAGWLDDHALFCCIGEWYIGGGGQGGWMSWPAGLRDRQPADLDEARRRHADQIVFFRYLQWQLDLQWQHARAQVAAEGVTLMGDLPFMVAGDSSDVWQRAHEFRLDATIGAPPDAFSADGQDWGLPVFRWDLMKQRDYEWMRERARRAAALFGLYRIDHVVGLFRTWYILDDKVTKGFVPADEPQQLLQGERLLEILKGGGGSLAPGSDSPVIAEDLGVVPDFVRRSLTRLGVPGYRVLRWELDGTAFRDPAGYPALSVATTGTHDTDSLADWYDELTAEQRQALCRIPGLIGLRQLDEAGQAERFDERVRDALLALLYRSGSDLVLVPFQDAFGHRERVNTPGTLNERNWSYRMPMRIDELAADEASTRRLAALAALR